MDSEITNDPEQEAVSETPEDVAILYSWANLHGAKYRDFSASRREYRAQIRHRAAEELRTAELRAKEEAEAAASSAEEAARNAERAASRSEVVIAPAERESALQAAESNARRGAAERLEAARRAEAAAMAEASARREEREIAEAHASAQRQAARYAESEIRRRTKAGPQPVPMIPGQMDDPYVSQQLAAVDLYTPDNALNYTQPERYRRGDSGIYGLNERGITDRTGLRQAGPPAESRRRPQGYRPDEASGIRPSYRPPAEQVRSDIPARPAYDRYAQGYPEQNRQPLPSAQFGSPSDRLANGGDRQPLTERSERQPQPQLISPEPVRAAFPQEDRRAEARPSDPAGPAWLYSQPAPVAAVPAPAVADTLQHSRERVASRWYALKSVFDQPGQAPPEEQPRAREVRIPVLTVFSLAGGVGKTSLVATLGRALSSMGEKVLLADTTSDGLLPYYFGASELRPGVVRTFSPPSGSTDAPIHLVSYDIDRRGTDRQTQDDFADLVARNSQGTNRLLFDINAQNGWIIRRLVRMNPTVLVPVAPDMNSIISLQSVERYFQEITDPEGRALQPYYMLNQFDASLPLHLDVREVLKRQLGDRLLPLVIRRAPAVSEALAEGMTVVDYAPEAQVAEDYLSVANWLRSVAAPASSGFRTVRWSEQ